MKPNLLYTDSAVSYWKGVLKTVEERIAGKAIDPAKDVSVGDKRISYYSFSELMDLRNFIKGKIAEEEDEEGISPNNEKKIVYRWGGW